VDAIDANALHKPSPVLARLRLDEVELERLRQFRSAPASTISDTMPDWRRKQLNGCDAAGPPPAQIEHARPIA